MSSIVNPENLKMVASGTALLLEPVSREAIELSGAEKPEVLLVGTAKSTPNDFEEFLVKANSHFEELGVAIANLHTFEQAPSDEEATHKIGSADMLWVTGGDTLKMMDFWKEHAIDTKIGEAALKGTVLAGGSAGMLAWFEQGHSDSLSYRVAEGEPWDYIFVKGLGYIAATGCPHYDSKTEGAEMREVDFARKYLADQTLPKIAIGITNRAALALNEGQYKVVAAPDEKWRSEVHIIRKTDEGLTDEQLPISSNYLPFNIDK